MRQALRSSKMSGAATAAAPEPPATSVNSIEPPSLVDDDSELNQIKGGGSDVTAGDTSCLMCSTVFEGADEFEYHIEVHASLCPSPCLRCCRSFSDRRLLYRHLHFKHGVAKRHLKEFYGDSLPMAISQSAVAGLGEDDDDEDGIDRMKRGFLPESSDVWKGGSSTSRPRDLTNPNADDGSSSMMSTAPTTTSRKPLKRCQICDKVFLKLTELRRHLVSSHSEVKPISCVECNRFFATARSYATHQRTVHGFLDRSNRKRSKKLDSNDGGPMSDGDANSEGDGDDEKQVTVVGPLENIVSEPDFEVLNDVTSASQKHFSSKDAWMDDEMADENEDLVFCVATKKDGPDRATRSEAVKYRVNLRTEEVLVTRVLGTNVANDERCFLYKCHWCSEIVVSIEALVEHIGVHARKQQKTVMCYNCGQLFPAGERGADDLKEHLRVYHGNDRSVDQIPPDSVVESRLSIHGMLPLRDEPGADTDVMLDSSAMDACDRSAPDGEQQIKDSVQSDRPNLEPQLEPEADNRICKAACQFPFNGSMDGNAAVTDPTSVNVKREPNDDVRVKLEPLEDSAAMTESSRHDDDDDDIDLPEIPVKIEDGDVNDMGDYDDEDDDEEEDEDEENDMDAAAGGESKNSSALFPSEVEAPSVVISKDGSRGFQCHVCKKLFDRLFSLNRHLRSHTGFKPCYCRECGKGFSEPRNLRHHVIRFHSDGSLRHLLRRAHQRNFGKEPRTATSDDRSHQDELDDDGGDASSPDAAIYSELSADGAEFGCQSSTGSENPENLLSSSQGGPPLPSQVAPWDQRDEVSTKDDEAGDEVLPNSSIVRHLFNQIPHGDIANASPLEDDGGTTSAVDLSLLPGRSRGQDYEDSAAGHASDSPIKPASQTSVEADYSDPLDRSLDLDPALGFDCDQQQAPSKKRKRKSGGYLSRYLPRLDIVASPVMRSKSSTKVLPNGKTVFTCLYCRKTFTTSSDLNRHMDFHEDLRPYKCEFCDYCSRTNSQLKVHMMRHQGIKQYPCDACDYFAVTQSDLNRHKKTRAHKLRAIRSGIADTSNAADKSGNGGDLEESSCSVDSGGRRSSKHRIKQEDDDDNGDGYDDNDLNGLRDENDDLDAASNDLCDDDDVVTVP